MKGRIAAFPPPWSVEEYNDACFVVRDNIGQQLAYIYFGDETALIGSGEALCRRLVLAATSPGAIMVPGTPSAVLKLATPRRYWDKDYMRRNAPEIYGGAFKKDPSLIGRHADAMSGARGLGYLYQLLALVGWSSLPWL